jgi:hypothetical protein
MLRRIRSAATYANVMATIAIFGTLGGVSYAAVDLTKNSVGPSEIKKSAVSSSEVKNHSLLCKDFKKSQDACGVKAVTRSATVTIPLTCTESGGGGFFVLGCDSSPVVVRAACKAGERATGGGYAESPFSATPQGGPQSGSTVSESRADPPAGAATAWLVKASGAGTNSGSTPGLAKPPDPSVTVYAVCAPA